MSTRYYPNRSGELTYKDFAETTITAGVDNTSTEIQVASDVFSHEVDGSGFKKFFYVVLEDDVSGNKVICAIDGFVAGDPLRLNLAAFNVIGEEANPNQDFVVPNGAKIRIAPITITENMSVINAPIERVSTVNDGTTMKPGFLTMDVSMWRPKGFELDTYPKLPNDPNARNTNGVSMVKADFCTSFGLSNYVKYGAHHSFLYGNNLSIKGTPDYNVLIGKSIDIADDAGPYDDKNVFVGHSITFPAGRNTIVGTLITDNALTVGRPSLVTGIGDNISFEQNVARVSFAGTDISVKRGSNQVHKGYAHSPDLANETESPLPNNKIGSKLIMTSNAIDLKSTTYTSEFEFKNNHTLLLDKVGFIIDKDNWNLPSGVNSSAVIKFQSGESVSPTWVDIHSVSLTSLSGDSVTNNESVLESVSSTSIKKLISYPNDWKLRVVVTTQESDPTNGVVGGYPLIEGALLNRSPLLGAATYDDPNNYTLGYNDGFAAGTNGDANDPTTGPNYVPGSNYYLNGYNTGYGDGTGGNS